MMSRFLLALSLLVSGGGCAALKQSTSAGLPYGVDCAFLHPLQDPGRDVIQRCSLVPSSVREHVHVYFVNGFDPLYVGNLKGLRDYVKQLGYANASCVEMAQAPALRNLIRKTSREDAAACFVLVGYSAGANLVRDLALELREDGIAVELLVYIGGDTIRNVPASKPGNVRTLLNIMGHGLVFLGYDLYFKGNDIDGAVNHRLDVRHMLLPSRAETAKLFAEHLAAIRLGDEEGLVREVRFKARR